MSEQPLVLYRLIQYGHHCGIGILEWLDANGHGALTICPVCHMGQFSHIATCTELLCAGGQK